MVQKFPFFLFVYQGMTKRGPKSLNQDPLLVAGFSLRSVATLKVVATVVVFSLVSLSPGRRG